MTVRAACIAGALLASVALAPAHAQPAATRSATELMDVLMWNREPVGGPFRLVDHMGKSRSDADFHGKLVLLYFGFTYCPDLCPTDLATIGVLVEKLGKAGESVQPLFVTLDP
jgi:cytochrome oxidase Cu insertion factor (SCO1/SenC/PrrC family)